MKKQQGRAKKSLGQHFLVDHHAIATIAEAVEADTTMVEIGPGRGAITDSLRQRASKLVVIEKDDAFATHWQQQALNDSHLKVAHGDVMQLLEPVVNEHRPQWIVGNLPYNISGPLTAMLVARNLSGGMVLMYQREVAERIAAEPGCGKVCGGISVISRYCWNIETLLTLPPDAFSPPPKVESAVLRFTPSGRLFDDQAFNALQQCVRTGFTHRRKTLANNFRGICDTEMWQQCDIDPALRPERLTLGQWLRLAILLNHSIEKTCDS